MPHSSGGGFSGGGFHTGGGFHSKQYNSSTPIRNRVIRYSRFYFPGAYCYIYYDRHCRPRTLYSDTLQSKDRKSSWISILIFALILLIPLAIIYTFAYHVPKKINTTSYDTTINIDDTADVLTDEEENQLKITFQSFLDNTGITPVFHSVANVESYRMETYGLSYYITHYSDEKHWVITYSKMDDGRWAYEGTQGNDTDNILTEYRLKTFNSDMYYGLSGENANVFAVVNNSFTKFNDVVMKPYYYVETPLIIFSVFWVVVFTYLIVSQVLAIRRIKHISQSEMVLQEEPILKKCPYCDSPYYAYTIDRCPKCGGEVDYPKRKPNQEPEFEDEYKGPEF